MNTRCPQCGTRYKVDPEKLFKANGAAFCFRCGTAFDVVEEQAIEVQARDAIFLASAVRLNRDDVIPDRTAPDRDLPFEVPDDLEPLQASPDAALDVNDMLSEKRTGRRVVYVMLALLLILALGLQLAWQYRTTLLAHYPALEPLCEHLPCRPRVVHAPGEFRVLERDIAATANEPGSLTLRATFRNDADTAQPLPDIQLSLLDSNGGVLARRRLAPVDYLFPSPPEDKTVAPGEVLTISFDFQDPGSLATGFIIDFL